MSTQINLQYCSMCETCLPSEDTHALSSARHWSMDASVARC